MRIIADSREPQIHVVDALRETGLDVELRELSSGDYLLDDEGGVAVERKAAADFVASIVDRRLFSQIAKMKADYETPIVIIEGDLRATRRGISEAAVLGACSWLSVIEKVSVHHTISIGETVSLLVVMARHAQEGLGYDVALRAAKPKNPSAVAQFLVEGLPGCGATTARKLLSHFGSAGAVFAAQEDELLAVPGVGKKLAARIRASLAAQAFFSL